MSGHDEEAPSVHRHHREAPRALGIAVVTVSDTRTLETDTGGGLIVELAEAEGHRLIHREIVPDDPERIRAALGHATAHAEVHAVILTGGTGVAPRDVTPETVEPLFERGLPGFGELFRMLSFEEIGAAALLSRSTAGWIEGRVVFALPGSRGALRTAMSRLILPELGHLVGESRKGAHG